MSRASSCVTDLSNVVYPLPPSIHRAGPKRSGANSAEEKIRSRVSCASVLWARAGAGKAASSKRNSATAADFNGNLRWPHEGLGEISRQDRFMTLSITWVEAF
jgi:hypothetical protein